LAAAILGAAFLGGAGSARAAELVMFETAGCPWCVYWKREIAPKYPKTDEGKAAPLRLVDMRAERPLDLAALDPVKAAPTFVLMHDGREVGRIVGFPGEDFFWPMLAQLLEKVPGSGFAALH
ncbi:MAG TPA: hypothetical protein PKZ97_16175, partial [Azospirillaceae bacterium]|nr:hypothetical protein [Azospirillaceae bacterium]